MNFENIYGKRIDLIEINMEGLMDMYEYSKNPSFYKHMEYKPHQSLEETRQYLKKLIRRSCSDSGHYWFIFLKVEEKIIGTFGLLNVDRRKGNAELGYGISPDYWGQGYFHETLMMVLKYLFLQLDFHRVSVITQADNVASIKALEKVGFRKEGIMRDYYLSFKDRRRYDAEMLAILRDEFSYKE